MIQLRKLEETDLEFLLEIRNDDSTRVNLENDNIFVLDECQEWFQKTNPNWFLILNSNNEKVGYLRTNNDEVGCDIHPNFRRQGFARMAYQEYLKDKEYATLWVFEDNFAINLYKELGFVENGENKVIRERNYLKMEYNLKKIKVCYVVNFWFGERRMLVKKYLDNQLFYLKKQIEFLKNLKNNIDTVILNFNLIPQHYYFIKDIFELVPKKINQTKVKVNFRENIGMSYGAFSDIFISNSNEFDYYIFNEDDYVFTQDNWDEYLVNKFNSIENCGYLSMIVSEPNSVVPIHAAHSTGISSYRVLQEVVNAHGELPHSRGHSYGEHQNDGQIKQTNVIHNLGYGLHDVRDDYCVLYLNSTDEIIGYHANNEKIIIQPAHLDE